jgi:hypothetical protein
MAPRHLRGAVRIGRESDFANGSPQRTRQPWAERTQFRLIVSVEVTYGHLLTHGSRRLNYGFADSRVKKHGRRGSHISRSSSYGGRYDRQGIRMAPRRSVWAVYRSTDGAKEVMGPSAITIKRFEPFASGASSNEARAGSGNAMIATVVP